MRKRALITCLFIILPVFASAESIRVVTEYLSPYQIKKVDGSLGGYMTEVVEALFKVTGDESNITVLPWARALKIAQSNKNVMIYTITNTPERKNNFHWIGPLRGEPIYLWGLKENFKTPVNDFKLLKSRSVVSIRGSNVPEFLLDNGFEEVTEVGQEVATVEMVYLNRVELVVSSKSALKYRAKKARVDLEKMTAVSVLEGLELNLNIAFSVQSDPKLVERYKNALAVLKENNTLTNIYQKWYGN